MCSTLKRGAGRVKRVVEQLANNNKVDLEKLISALINTDVDFDELYKTIKGT